MKDRICSSCRWYVNEECECRRYPPPNSDGAFPIVSANDWCGEYSEVIKDG